MRKGVLHLPRYGLRTLFVVVTVLAVFIGYHVNWIRQRHDFLKAETIAREATGDYSSGIEIPAPAVLRLFGETGWSGVFIVVDGPSARELTELDIQKLARARSLFPESVICGSCSGHDNSGLGGWRGPLH